jgi:hypothetical protein
MVSFDTEYKVLRKNDTQVANLLSIAALLCAFLRMFVTSFSHFEVYHFQPTCKLDSIVGGPEAPDRIATAEALHTTSSLPSPGTYGFHDNPIEAFMTNGSLFMTNGLLFHDKRIAFMTYGSLSMTNGSRS